MIDILFYYKDGQCPWKIWIRQCIFFKCTCISNTPRNVLSNATSCCEWKQTWTLTDGRLRSAYYSWDFGCREKQCCQWVTEIMLDLAPNPRFYSVSSIYVSLDLVGIVRELSDMTRKILTVKANITGKKYSCPEF